MTTLSISAAAESIAHGVADHGGATVSAIAGIPSPTKGYAVSLPGYELDLGGRNWHRRSGSVSILAADYIEAHRALLAGDPTLYVGAWVDGDRLVFDISRVHGCLADAVHAGLAADQDAIYSFETGAELQLKPGRVSTHTAEQAAVWQVRRDALGLPLLSDLENDGLTDAQALDAIADLLNQPGQWNGGDVCAFVAEALQATGRTVSDGLDDDDDDDI